MPRENAPLPLAAGEVAWLGARRSHFGGYAIAFTAGLAVGLLAFAFMIGAFA